MTLVHQIGNFHPPFSTENELHRALLSLGVRVQQFQENNAGVFNDVCLYEIPDLIIWTRTRWHPEVPRDEQLEMLARARSHGVPVVGYHLDRWWGLNREGELGTEPFFKVDTLYTADGGPHDWESKGINHKWLPPAVDAAQCVRGTPRDEYKSELAFIGSWDGGYHKEHRHRMELVTWLSQTYGSRITFWPKEGLGQIRGKDLQDLIASVDVIIGDSCFTGTDHYWSDRIPETLGRGGFLIHPYIKGLHEEFTLADDEDILRKDLIVWEPGNWQQLRIVIEHALNDHEMRRLVSSHGQNTVKEKHTYKVRMQQVLDDHS